LIRDIVKATYQIHLIQTITFQIFKSFQETVSNLSYSSINIQTELLMRGMRLKSFTRIAMNILKLSTYHLVIKNNKL